MKRFVEGEDREQGTLLPERLDDYVAEPVLLKIYIYGYLNRIQSN